MSASRKVVSKPSSKTFKTVMGKYIVYLPVSSTPTPNLFDAKPKSKAGNGNSTND